MSTILIVAVVALLLAAVAQVQNAHLRHRIARVETTHRALDDQQRRQAKNDLDALIRVVAHDRNRDHRAERDTARSLGVDVDAEVGHVLDEAERILRDGDQ